MNTAKHFSTSLLFAVCSVSAQDTSVSFTGPRSLMMALLEIQAATGTPISYEEPRYEYAGDLTRTSPSTHPGLRPMLVIARTSPSAVIVSLPGLGKASDPMIFVQAVLDAYNKADLPGRYKAVRRGNGIDVVPSQVAGFNGAMKGASSVMSLPVTSPHAERPIVDALQLIANAISNGSGRAVKLLATPFYSRMPSDVAWSADNLSAAEALSSLAKTIGVGGVSYQLAYEPNEDAYYLTVTSLPFAHPVGSGRRDEETGTTNWGKRRITLSDVASFELVAQDASIEQTSCPR